MKLLPVETDENIEGNVEHIGSYFFYQALKGRASIEVLSTKSVDLAKAIINFIDEDEYGGSFFAINDSDSDNNNGYYYGFDSHRKRNLFFTAHKDVLLEVFNDIFKDIYKQGLKGYLRKFTPSEVSDFNVVMVVNYMTVGSNTLTVDQEVIYEHALEIIFDEILHFSLLEYEALLKLEKQN